MEETLRQKIFEKCNNETVHWTLKKWRETIELELNISLQEKPRRRVFKDILIERVMDFVESDSEDECGSSVSSIVLVENPPFYLEEEETMIEDTEILYPSSMESLASWGKEIVRTEIPKKFQIGSKLHKII